MINKVKITFLIIFIFSLFTSLASPAMADWFGGPLIPAECTGSDTTIGNCGVTQALQTIINVSRLILAITGSAALLMFIYGGLVWIIAAGSQEKIEKGKTAMQAAVIGLAIILGAWLIVNFTIYALTGGKAGLTGIQQLFGQDWSKEQSVKPSEAPEKTIEPRTYRTIGSTRSTVIKVFPRLTLLKLIYYN